MLGFCDGSTLPFGTTFSVDQITISCWTNGIDGNYKVLSITEFSFGPVRDNTGVLDHTASSDYFHFVAKSS